MDVLPLASPVDMYFKFFFVLAPSAISQHTYPVNKKRGQGVVVAMGGCSTGAFTDDAWEWMGYHDWSRFLLRFSFLLALCIIVPCDVVLLKICSLTPGLR